MEKTKKVRVKVKKRRLKIKNILIFLLAIVIISNSIYCILNIKIKNIYIINNKLVSDKEILNDSKLIDYPSYLLSFNYKIKDNLLNNNLYIKDVEITKNSFKVYLYITEYKRIAIYNNKIILESGNLVDNNYNIKSLPIIISNIDEVYDDFVKYFSKIDDDVIVKISQIEYAKTEVDDERFLLYMNDGNSVYVTFSKIEKINKYSSIVGQMEGKKGIIHLDSGDYVELK